MEVLLVRHKNSTVDMKASHLLLGDYRGSFIAKAFLLPAVPVVFFKRGVGHTNGDTQLLLKCPFFRQFHLNGQGAVGQMKSCLRITIGNPETKKSLIIFSNKHPQHNTTSSPQIYYNEFFTRILNDLLCQVSFLLLFLSMTGASSLMLAVLL